MREEGKWAEQDNCLLRDILVACFADKRKGEQKNISTTIAQWAQSIVIFLSCKIHRMSVTVLWSGKECRYKEGC